MSGLHEDACGGCGRRFETSVETDSTHRVLRCACGQSVRVDTESLELGAEPGPASAVSDPEQRRSLEPSSLDAARTSRPVSHRSSHSSLPPPEHVPSTPLADKPHWHVDLGGTEPVRMTIEQLIVARRSGKLGEGALVWRKGMPSWRPVGSLIPAVSRSTPTPPAPSRSPLPPAPSRATPLPAQNRSTTSPPEDGPHSLASYERPVPTLEFALEKSDEPSGPPLPNQDRSPLRSPRTATPLPSQLRSPLRSPRTATPVPRAPTSTAAGLARAAKATPVPALPPLTAPPVPRASPVPGPCPPVKTELSTRRTLENTALDWLGDRPRWLSACIALLVCFTASGSGAFLVRSLKQRKQPLAVTSRAAIQLKASARAAGSGAEPAAPAAPPPPLVVELESLSIEHSPARPAARPVAKVPTPQPVTGPNGEGAEAANDESSLVVPTSTQRPKTSDPPAAARANPYLTGGSDEALRQKKATPGGDESPF
jgi:hypothetical protein